MKAIIVYNTATGHTRFIADRMKEILEKYKHECVVHRDKSIKNEVSVNQHYFDAYNLICLGSCTHGSSPASSFKKFLQSIKNYDLKEKSLICFSSSASPNDWKHTCDTIKKFFPDTRHIGKLLN